MHVASRTLLGWECGDIGRRCDRLEDGTEKRNAVRVDETRVSSSLPVRPERESKDKDERHSLTVDALHRRYEVAQGHLLYTCGFEVGKDAGSGGELLVEVLLGPAIVLQGELDRHLCIEICVEDAERIELRLVMPPDLVGPDEQLDLRGEIE